jgi:hypothetical protein
VVVVAKEGDTFTIDDVHYGGGTYNRNGTLSNLLQGCANCLAMP